MGCPVVPGEWTEDLGFGSLARTEHYRLRFARRCLSRGSRSVHRSFKHPRRQQQPALSLALPFGRVSYSRRRISPPTCAWIETRSGIHLLRRAVTSVKKPVPIDIAWEPTRPSYAPPRVAASRSPIAFGRPEPCRRSSGVFDPRRAPCSRAASSPARVRSRISSSDECAGTAVYFASRASDFVTGTTLFVDGGVAIR